jgi:hypothetical protein
VRYNLDVGRIADLRPVKVASKKDGWHWASTSDSWKDRWKRSRPLTSGRTAHNGKLTGGRKASGRKIGL